MKSNDSHLMIARSPRPLGARVTIDRHRVILTRFLLPWLRKRIPRNDIERVYFRKRYRSTRPHNDGPATFEIWLLTRRGIRIRVFPNVPAEGDAFFLAERIESFLGRNAQASS